MMVKSFISHGTISIISINFLDLLIYAMKYVHSFWIYEKIVEIRSQASAAFVALNKLIVSILQ